MSLNKSKVLRTAEKYVLQGKLPAAIDEYRKVVDADPADLTTINTLGDLYVRAGKIQDAIINFSRIADSYREGGFTLKAIAMLKKISKLDPTNVETSMKLANLYSQQGLLVEARQQYLQVADAYARQGQTRKALDAYQKIADLDPSNTSVRMKLGEIYSRESMSDQAHESFILAGVEFLRKGDTEQALNANLKAIAINPDSRQALTAIATIYTQHGQIDRAINILCEAFERNPGDVELLTILGRTYLSASLMDDAERTFLSLVELDRNRYHYLLEVGRRFLQMGDMDRAAEQIDGCLDVLIAKREEDKAIDFLRKILDRDMNHIGALKRLAQIFLRIREDHNLIATLNSLVEAAMRKGKDEDAIEALKELARLEPDEPMHLQRLYNLGVKDIVESDSPDVIRATGPLDFESAAYDDTFVIRQISEAEILAGHGQIDHAVQILSEILNHAPENVQLHLKLKDIYLRAGIMDKAAEQCLELGRIYEARGESARASDFMAEARQINPLLETPTPAPPEQESRNWANESGASFDYEASFAGSNGNSGSGAFDLREPADALDWNKYQTGALTDQSGFITMPGEAAHSNGANGASGDHASSNGSSEFRYSDTLMGGPDDDARSNAAELAFTSAANVPSDTMSRVMQDELEGIDFYIAQGYIEIAQDTLDRLRGEHGDHPEIMTRYERLGVTQPAGAPSPVGHVSGATPQEDDFTPAGTLRLPGAPGFAGDNARSENGNGGIADYSLEVELQEDLPSFASELAGSHVEIASTEAAIVEPDSAQRNVLPFLVSKESGPLYPDLLVQLNTSELLHDTMFDSAKHAPGARAEIVKDRVGTADLIESFVSNMDSSFSGLQRLAEERRSDAPPPLEQLRAAEEIAEPVALEETIQIEAVAPVYEIAPVEEAALIEQAAQPEAKASPSNSSESVELAGAVESAAPSQSWNGGGLDNLTDGDDLQSMFEELRENTGTLQPIKDFETHYSLGLAYKDMDLLDDAIGEFQRAFRMAGVEDLKGDYIQCCNMLGVCFKRKHMPKVAVMWFERGLNIPNRPEDEYQALRYEIALCYEELAEFDKALDVFMEVYGVDVSYREVSGKIKQLQSAKDA
jgi:tetratricopeptide (TPR) repeat protein